MEAQDIASSFLSRLNLVFNFCFSNSLYIETDIIIGLIEYGQNSLLGASHLVDYISFHIQFGLERHLLSRPQTCPKSCELKGNCQVWGKLRKTSVFGL